MAVPDMWIKMLKEQKVHFKLKTFGKLKIVELFFISFRTRTGTWATLFTPSPTEGGRSLASPTVSLTTR